MSSELNADNWTRRRHTNFSEMKTEMEGQAFVSDCEHLKYDFKKLRETNT